MNALIRLLHDDAAATMVEYAVVVAFIAIVCFILVEEVGRETASNFNSYNVQMSSV